MIGTASMPSTTLSRKLMAEKAVSQMAMVHALRGW
jgi:hypothetical protein